MKKIPLAFSLNNVAIVWENGAVLVGEVEKGRAIISNSINSEILDKENRRKMNI